MIHDRGQFMDVRPVDNSTSHSCTRDVWLHELRNAVNRIGLHSALAQRLLDLGRDHEAAAELAECRSAWDDSCRLLDVAPPTDAHEPAARPPH
ncbi:hypothetical protein [Lysobacter sp. HA18]